MLTRRANECTIPARLRVTLGLWLWAVMLLCFAILLTDNWADYDLWGRMSVGALIHQNGTFPRHDVFSYTAPGALWIDHEWGSGVVFYRILLAFGSPGLTALKLLLLAAPLLLIHHSVALPALARRAPGSDRTAASALYILALAMAPGALLPGYAATIRCQEFSFLFFAAFLCILERFRSEPAARPWETWLLPALTVLWTNLHGGIAYGFFAMGLYVAWFAADGERLRARRLLLVLAMCAAAVLVNPYGHKLAIFLVKAWAMPRGRILEWADLFEGRGVGIGLPYYTYALLLAGLALLAWSRNYRRFPGFLFLLAATGLQGLRHCKLLPFFALAALCASPSLQIPSVRLPRPLLAVWRRHAFRVALYVPAALACASVAMLAILAGPDAFRVKVPADPIARPLPYPVHATRFLQTSGATGNLWCVFHHGEFLYWCLYPAMRVSVDGRYEEVYPERVAEDAFASYYDLHNPKPDLANRYGSTHLMIPRAFRYMAHRVAQDPQWHLLYEDPGYRIYTRAPVAAPTRRAAAPAVHYADKFVGDLRRFAAREAMATGKDRPF